MMQIVIPMSGLGSRFIHAGYTVPKPLIEVHGKPIIDWVTRLFPGEQNILFICRESHLKNTAMRGVLESLTSTANIIAVPGDRKGPVYAVSKAFHCIKDSEPVIVSYCDYFMLWDYVAFKRDVLEQQYDGAIPCYTGFHPHLLHKKNVYASCRVDEDNFLQEIREKYVFGNNKMNALHSPGIYYFRNGAILKTYFQKMLDDNIQLNGEYYVSLVYNLLVQNSLRVYVPHNVKYFCQWGTPEDLSEYLFWVNQVKSFES